MRRTGSYLPRVRTSPVALAVLLAPALPIPTLFMPVSRPIPVASGRSSDEEHVQNRDRYYSHHERYAEGRHQVQRDTLLSEAN